MGNTYVWIICAMECLPVYEGKTNVVSIIHWRRLGKNADGISSDISGSQELTYDASHPFTPYENLTPAQAIAWIEAKLTAEEIAALDAILDAQIADKAKPEITVLPLPWG